MAEDKNKSEKKDNPHKGHRNKVRNRYYETGFNGMADHNVLEMLLFFGIPYKDTNEMAHELIARFGSFSGVLEADVKDLITVKGMTENAACLITMILPLYKRYMEDVSSQKPEFASKEELSMYIRSLFLDTNDERLYALAYDSSRHYIGYRNIGDGDICSSRADIRKLSAFVLECKATGIILAHNHPHGIALPSPEDIECTKYIYKILDALKVRLLDHIIVNESDYISMAETMRYTYIFSGIEQSPFEKEFDEEFEKAREAVEHNDRRKNAEKVKKMLEKINNAKANTDN
ncbi:MAG: hypothetical protein IKY78_07870 [Clostridia bacterium]|nr:hypothetical protein [Clostridia bacterium]